VAHRHRKFFARTFDQLGVEQRDQPRGVGRGRHRQQAEFRPQGALQVKAKSQRQIGLQRAFVHLVEDNRRDAIQAGIGLQTANEQAFRHHFDAGAGGHGGIEAGAVADGFAHGLTQQRGHAGGGGAGGQAARFQHEDAAVAAPGGREQRQRHQRGFASTWRRHQHRVAPGFQRGGERRQRLGDGEVGQLGEKACGHCGRW
jgi:hypothetical protein